MQFDQVDWLPSLVMLAVGVIGGVILIVWLRRNAPAASTEIDGGDLETRDLEAKRDALIRLLRELDDTSSKMTAGQLAAERYRLELETAAVLRELHHETSASAAVAERVVEGEAAVAPRQPQSAMAGFLWGVAAMAVIAALVALVVQRATPRESGETATGNTPMRQPETNAEIAQLEQAVQANPENLEARLDLAFGYLAQRDLMKVFNQTEYVLQKDPGNARALAYQSLVRLAIGQAADAEAMVKKAIEKDPNLLEAWINLAIIYVDTGREKEAMEAIDEAERRHPDQRETLESVRSQLRQAAETPSGAPAAPGGEVAAASGPSISGSVQLAPGRVAPATGQLFVSVRPAGVAAGPPVAVKMLGAASLPASFTITAQDSMMGQPLPEKMRIDARLDSDGNVMSRDPSDPQGFLDNVSIGSSGLQLVLK